MSQCVRFEFITDTRFGGTKKQLISMDKKLKKSGLNIRSNSDIRELDWKAESYHGAKPSKQWRKSYLVEKNGTWNDTYGKINKIKPVFFKKEGC